MTSRMSAIGLFFLGALALPACASDGSDPSAASEAQVTVGTALPKAGTYVRTASGRGELVIQLPRVPDDAKLIEFDLTAHATIHASPEDGRGQDGEHTGA